MNKAICLIALPSPFLIDDFVFPPLGILYLVSALKHYDVQAQVHDGQLVDIPKGFSHYGISATTPQFPQAVEALQQIKKENPQARVIIGGPHSTVDPESCKKAGFDCVVSGPGEVALHLATAYQCSLVEVPKVPYIKPDRSAIDLRKYRYTIDGIPATSVMTSRGCPYSCAFCCKSTGKHKVFPAEAVINELIELHFGHKYNAFMFFDDLFIYDPKRLKTVLDHITPWGIKWRGFVRADLMLKGGSEMVALMKKSGCVEVGMGVESGSDKILATINKGETTDTIKKAIKLLKRGGIRVKGFFIVGLPGESETTILETVNFLTEVDLDDADFSIFTPYKGSEIYENRLRYDIFWDNLELQQLWYKGKKGEYQSLVSTSHLSKEEIVTFRDKLEEDFKNGRSV